jgi:hypothetical protein
MWFPVDDGMVNLERVALIRIGDNLEVKFFNDARAHLTTASFEEDHAFQDYVDRLQQELPVPMLDADDAERFPSETSSHALVSASGDDSDAKSGGDGASRPDGDLN